MEKKNIDGNKKKTIASIPANYVSILQLQERWMREKEGKHKDKGLVERGVKLEKNSLGGGSRRPCGVNRSEKESLDGEESKCVEKEKLEVSADGENEGGDSRQKRKKWSKKKKIQGGSMAEVVKCESKASPAYIRKENNSVKEEIRRVHKPNGENAVVRDSIGLETQFQDLCINKRVEDEGREVKGPARLNNGLGYERKQRHDWSSPTHVIRAGKDMVWVKKGKNDGAGGRSENGI